MKVAGVHALTVLVFTDGTMRAQLQSFRPGTDRADVQVDVFCRDAGEASEAVGRLSGDLANALRQVQVLYDARGGEG